ncbi:Uncharacterised protein [Vibrio anguillarum]|nr:Uncharacterised protein [Vibrio anguillarum]
MIYAENLECNFSLLEALNLVLDVESIFLYKFRKLLSLSFTLFIYQT